MKIITVLVRNLQFLCSCLWTLRHKIILNPCKCLILCGIVSLLDKESRREKAGPISWGKWESGYSSITHTAIQFWTNLFPSVLNIIISQSIHFTILWVDPAAKANTQSLERGRRLVSTPTVSYSNWQLTFPCKANVFSYLNFVPLSFLWSCL